jgi:ATP-binding cassette, subfamily B, multidrug efflux pump
MVRYVVPYMRRYRWMYVLGLTLTVITAALGTMVPWFLRQAIDQMQRGAPSAGVWRIGLVMIGTAIGMGALRYLMREVLNGVSRRIETDLRRDLFAALTTRDASWYLQWRTGDLMARLTNDLSAVRMAVGPAVMYMANTVAGGCFALVMMMRIDVRLTLAALLPMLGLPVLMIVLGRRVHARFEAVQEHFSSLTTRVQENLAGVRVVRAFRQERPELARFTAMSTEYAQRNMALARLNALMNPGFGLLAGLGTAITIGFGGQLLVRGALTVGAFVAFSIYLAQLTWPLIALGWTTNLFQRGSASLSRLLVLTEDVELGSGVPRASPPARRGGPSLTFDRVWFHYPLDTGEPRWVVRDVSFHVPAGGVLGIVGATGAGKSALLDLIPRVFEPQRGSILLDGVPIATLDRAALRARIGAVPQDTLLFSEPIGENVLYGVSDAVRDDAAARAARQEWAAELGQLSTTIAALPTGFETMLGERGINLSGGQKQRTAIARALARDPDVVLLDDALSAVDTATEAAILAGLRTVLAGRTTVIVAHRVSTVREADHIVVLEQGAIVEAGTHAQLLALSGRYAALDRRQRLEEELEESDPRDRVSA